MPKRLILALAIALCAVTLAACSRSEPSEQPETGTAVTMAQGSDAALPSIEAAVRAMTREKPTVDFVAAEVEGVIMARTRSQALMHYEGYRIILMTPTDLVTRITFQFDEAKPSIGQLTELYGKPEVEPNGMLYQREALATGARVNILAVPVTMPAEDHTLIRELRIQGTKTR